MKMQWIECNKVFNREFFDRISEIPENTGKKYVLLKVQDIFKGAPQSYSTKYVLLTLERTASGAVNGMIGCTRYFDMFDNIYVIGMVEIDMENGE